MAMLSVGELGERIAQDEYKRLGYKILGTNVFNRYGKRAGEIDFIALKNNSIVFVEVKTRTKEMGKFGTALDSIHTAKIKKLLLATKLFLRSNPKYTSFSPRIDACVVLLNTVDNSVRFVKIIESAVQETY